MNDTHELKLRLVKLINPILMTGGFAVVWFMLLRFHVYDPYSMLGNLAVIFFYLLLYCWFGRTYEAFMVSYSRISELIYSQMLSAVASNTVMYFVCILLFRTLPSVVPMFLILSIQFVISVGWSWPTHVWYFNHYRPKKTVIVWDMRQGMEELVESYGMSKKFDVIADYSAEDCIKDLSVLDSAEVVFLSGVHSHDRNIIIKHCIRNRIVSFIVPRVGDVLMSGAHRMHLFHLPILRLAAYQPNPEYVIIKRGFDIVFSLFALLITAPIQVIVAAAIKLEDGGPVLYKQVRLTKNGREFQLFKYRSMRVDAENDGVARLSNGENDDRITNVGKVIRRMRLDELPQFVNILCGDMSIVGPRPERPEIAAQYEKELPEFHLRLQAKCGLTGYAQVYGKYNTEPYDKLQMDLLYIAKPSISEDLSIIFATIKILFLKDSTEGVEEGQSTALLNAKK
ncbi:MAG: sugar transferase [Lachnospiraceae bacterium]|nr:sugar transferase [Lachnospiraceae bacterium]